jgi:glutaredoxin
MKHVAGIRRGEVVLYGLSTCVWCKKTKRLLEELGVAYGYVDVDLLPDEERRGAEEEIRRLSTRGAYPLIVLNGEETIQGFDEEAIRERLGP